MSRPAVKTRLDLQPAGGSPSDLSSSQDPSSTTRGARGGGTHTQFHMGGRVSTDMSDLSTTNNDSDGAFGDLGSAARTNSDFDMWDNSPSPTAAAASSTRKRSSNQRQHSTTHGDNSGGASSASPRSLSIIGGYRSFTVPRMNPLEAAGTHSSSTSGGGVSHHGVSGGGGVHTEVDPLDPFADLYDHLPAVPTGQGRGDGGGVPSTSSHHHDAHSGLESPGEDPFAGIIDSAVPTPIRTLGGDATAGIGRFESTTITPQTTTTQGGATEDLDDAANNADDWTGWYLASDGFWYRKEDADLLLVDVDPYTYTTGGVAAAAGGEDADAEEEEDILLLDDDVEEGIEEDEDMDQLLSSFGLPSNRSNRSILSHSQNGSSSTHGTPHNPLNSTPRSQPANSNTVTSPGGAAARSQNHQHPSASLLQGQQHLQQPSTSPQANRQTTTPLTLTPSLHVSRPSSFTSPPTCHTPGTNPQQGSHLISPSGGSSGVRNGSITSSSAAGSPTFRPPIRQVGRRGGGSGDPNDESNSDLHKLRFKRIKELGRGAFGEVYLCMNILTGSLMAAKHIRLDDATIGSKLVRDVQREINIMSNVPDHPNVVRYIGSQEGHKCMYIFMEVVSGGSVEGLLKATRQRFHEATIQQYAFMVLLGLQHLHLNNIVHQDVKGANVLIDNAGIAKIADFGCCKDLGAMHMNSSKTAGSPLFMSPEVCRGDPADTRSDIWSFGCFLLEMAKDDRRPWSGFGKEQSLFAIIYAISSAKEPPEVPTYLSPVCQHFIKCCLAIDPAERWTTEQLLNHQFFEEDSIFDMDVLDQLHSEGDFFGSLETSPQRGGADGGGGPALGDAGGGHSSTFVRSTLKIPQVNSAGVAGANNIGEAGGDFGEGDEAETQQLYQFSLGSAKSTYNDAFTPVGLRSLKQGQTTTSLGARPITQQQRAAGGGGSTGTGGGMMASTTFPVVGGDSPKNSSTAGGGGQPNMLRKDADRGPLLCHYSGGGTISSAGGGGAAAPLAGGGGPPSSLTTGQAGGGGGGYQQQQNGSPPQGGNETRQLALVAKVSGSANKRGKKPVKNTGALAALLNKFKCGI